MIQHTIFAAQYGWPFLIFLFSVPASTWACAGVTVFAAMKRKKELAWLIPSHIPIFISIGLLISFFSGNGSQPLGHFDFLAFILPGFVSIVAVFAFIHRRKGRPNKSTQRTA